MREAYATASCTVETHVQFHGCLEPHACVASWDAGAQMLRMNISTQGIFDDQENLAPRAGAEARPGTGSVTPTSAAASVPSATTPAKSICSRRCLARSAPAPCVILRPRAEECITALRHAARFTYEMGAAKDGTVTSIKMKALRSGGAHTLAANELPARQYRVRRTHISQKRQREVRGREPLHHAPALRGLSRLRLLEGGIGFAQVIDMLRREAGHGIRLISF